MDSVVGTLKLLIQEEQNQCFQVQQQVEYHSGKLEAHRRRLADLEAALKSYGELKELKVLDD